VSGKCVESAGETPGRLGACAEARLGTAAGCRRPQSGASAARPGDPQARSVAVGLGKTRVRSYRARDVPRYAPAP